MIRIVISTVVGIALALGLPALVAFVFYGGSEAIIPSLLYWPLLITDRLGLGDCYNADDLNDKLACMRMAFIIDVIVYPLATFVFSYTIHRVFFQGRAHLHPSHVDA